MTKRKFTPPTEFSAEYVDGEGNKMVVLGMSHNELYPLIGFNEKGHAVAWTEDGEFAVNHNSRRDLHDIPKRITTWYNVHKGFRMSYPYSSKKIANLQSQYKSRRLCIYRIESDEDGGNPEIFVEEVR